jgi:predicted outer membrane repeat protein
MSTSGFCVRCALVVLGLVGLLSLAGPAAADMIQVAEGDGATGLLLRSQTRGGVEIEYAMDRFGFEPIDINGTRQQVVVLPGCMLPNDAGAPNLPGIGRMVAMPQGAEAVLTITATQTRTYNDVDVAPAAPIQFENDDTPPRYERDMSIYGSRALYPASPVVISEPMQIRGVDVVTVGVTPFQYNPITRELTVYTQIDFRLDFVGGNGQYGENRLRNRYWEPLLRDHLLNYSALPVVDFNEAGGGRSGYEYIIICPNDATFEAKAEEIKAWRKLQGISTEVYTLAEVGGTTSTAIENFINTAYNTWDTPPEAFLILGDYPSTGDDYAVTSPTWNGYCVSDNIYADVNGDNLPDMAHGRICAHSSTDLDRMVGRMMQYETAPVMDPNFYAHPVIAGGWQTERWFILCTEVCYGHQVNVLGKTPTREYAIYQGNPGTQWSSNQNTYMIVNYFGPTGLGYIPATPAGLTDWGGNATRIVNDLNAGAYMLLHRDHGLETGWGEPAFSNSNLNQINFSGNRYPFVFTINCLTGKYNWSGECFAEKFHRQQYGAVGVIAPSEVSYSFVNDTFIWGMWDSMWPEFDPGHGASDNIGASNLMTAFAMASGKYYLQASNWPYNPSNKIHTHHLFHHHGDAFIRMYTQVPQQLNVVHDDHLEFDATSFTVQANQGAVIALTVNGEIIGVADATSGPVNVPIIPQSQEGQLRITITKADYLRYDVTIPIEAGSILVNAEGTGTYATIQAAINGASEGNQIYLEDGVFTGPGNRDLDTFGKQLTIESLSGHAAACIIDCQGTALAPHRGFRFHSGETATTLLRNFTIRNGWGPGETSTGGGIVCESAAPNLTGLVFENNTAERGGALLCTGAAPTISRCTFEENTAVTGAAILFDQGSSPWPSLCTFRNNTTENGTVACETGSAPHLMGCSFQNNVGVQGAGLFCSAGSNAVLTSCTFTGNSTEPGTGGRGGAVYFAGASPTLTRCNFFDNSAEDRGGAANCESSPAAFSFCQFAGNQSANGGVMALTNSGVTVTSCTMYGNCGTTAGGCVFVESGLGTFEKDIFSFSTAGAAFECVAPEGLDISCCDAYGNAGGDWTGYIAGLLGTNGNFALDPAFCDASVRDFTLWNYSPCQQYACGLIGTNGIECFGMSDAEEELVASGMLLGRALPNPFVGTTTIAFQIPSDAASTTAMLEVFDPSGRLVRTLVNETLSAGSHVVAWDGTNAGGERVASGVYYYQLRVGDQSDTQRVVLMR